LIELILVVLILAALAGLVIPYLAEAREKANNARAMEEIRGLEIDISTYFAGHGEYPASLGEIGRGTLEDPWGNLYHYLLIQGGGDGVGGARKDRFVVPLNSDYDLYSAGKDGESASPLTASVSQDDIIRAGDGAFVGLASEY
jgi:general secretion pathway protein G